MRMLSRTWRLATEVLGVEVECCRDFSKLVTTFDGAVEDVVYVGDFRIAEPLRRSVCGRGHVEVLVLVLVLVVSALWR